MAVRIAAALAVVALAGAIVLNRSAGAARNAPRIVAGAALASARSNWVSDWVKDDGAEHPRLISMLEPSLGLTDFRMELHGKIESQAIGWVFRAKDPKNYYAMKLEVARPGPEFAVALTRFAVIGGDEKPHSQVPLALLVRPDTTYRVRFEGIGNRFTTWIQDQKVDEFTDDRIGRGGIGLLSERGELAAIQGTVSVVPLTIKK